MKQITEKQYLSLTDKIYHTLMAMPDMGMGEMGEARDESIRIADEWLSENGIAFPEPQPIEQSKEGFTGGKYWYRESTSVYNPHYVVENTKGEIFAHIYHNAFNSVMQADKAAKQFVSILNRINHKP